MRKTHYTLILLATSMIFFVTEAHAQQPDTVWNLQKCIDYAVQNNIQIKKAKVNLDVSKVNLDEAQASRLPGLTGGINESYTHQQPVNGAGSSHSNSFTGDYSLHSGMVLYNGNKINNTVNLQKLGVQSGSV